MIRQIIFASFLFVFLTGSASAATESEIKATQALLNILGYDVGPVDGVMGAGTQNAMQSFLRDRRLKTDAKIGPELLQSLAKAISEQPAKSASKPSGGVSLHSVKADIQSSNPNAGIFSDKARLFIRFKNGTEKTVVGVEHQFVVKNAFGTVLHRGRDEMEIKILPRSASSGELYYFWEDNQFIHDEIYDKVSIAFSNGTEVVDVKILKVVFSDGTSQSYK